MKVWRRSGATRRLEATEDPEVDQALDAMSAPELRALGSPITAVARNPDHLDLFVTGADGLNYSTWWDAAAGWGTWFHVSGGAAALGSPITAIARNPDHLDLFVTGADGLIYSTWWDQ
jgi:hypothetical protein